MMPCKSDVLRLGGAVGRSQRGCHSGEGHRADGECHLGADVQAPTRNTPSPAADTYCAMSAPWKAL